MLPGQAWVERLVDRRPIDAEGDTTAPLAQAVGRLNLPHEFAPPTSELF